MKNLLLSGVFVLFSTFLFGQVGVSGAYRTFSAVEWMELINDLTENRLDNPTGFNVAIDYRLRLINKRIEFLPEIGYTTVESSTGSSSSKINLLGFHLNTNLYPFDLEGDCDCPTWSKSGNVFEKGFFVQVAPGVVRSVVKVGDGNTTVFDVEETFFEIGIGAGLDIGVSDFFTVTPLVKYYFAPNVGYYPSTAAPITFGPASSNLNQLYAGIRLGFQFGDR